MSAVLVASLLAPVSASAGTTGVVAGTVTDELTGLPLDGISVRLHSDALGWFAREWTAADGSFTFSGVDPGTYHVRYDDWTGGIYAREFFDDTGTLGAATPVTVTADATSTADAALGWIAPPSTGWVGGHVTADGNGQPLAGISVRLHTDTAGWFAQTFTDTNGDYLFADLDPDTYHVRYDDPFGGTYDREFWNDQPTLNAADDVVVGAGTLAVADASLAGTPVPQNGSIGGTVVADADGQPIAGVSVRLHTDTAGWFSQTFTDTNGDYLFADVTPGAYHLRYDDPGGIFDREYWDDQPTLNAADEVAVGDGQDVVADASLAGDPPVGPPPITGRDLDPVVVAGAALPALTGGDPDDIVGFAWNGTGWDQIPVQVDERHMADLKKLRDGSGSIGHQVLAYSDPGANAGADPNTTFDSNDEVVFLGGDTGPLAPGGAADPAGVTASTRVDVEVTDPTDPSAAGYVSLFVSTTLDPAAGVDLVSYSYSPLGGGLENSVVQTDHYRTRFAARWVRDELKLPSPYGSNADILDRHSNLFAPGVCSRSEDTFSSGGGGFATHVDGPLRAIRSYLGANSGTYTQREHRFYPGHEVTTTYLRVHQIPGMLDLWDYSSNAIGMTYASNVQTSPVTINGNPDSVAAGFLTWERVDGNQGGVIHAYTFETDINPSSLTITSYYTDDSTPPQTQCTGDAFEYGTSGPWIASQVPNTDPTANPYKSVAATRTTTYVEGGTTASVVGDVVAGVNGPLAGGVAP